MKGYDSSEQVPRVPKLAQKSKLLTKDYKSFWPGSEEAPEGSLK